MGRPKLEIDFTKVDDYLKAQCNGTAIAGILGVSPDTLYRATEERFKMTFTAYSAQKRAEGKEILRKSIWDDAIGSDKVRGNPILKIWLSKQYLGFTESLEKISDEAIELIIEKLKSKYEKTSA